MFGSHLSAHEEGFVRHYQKTVTLEQKSNGPPNP
jgi:hypothetical protein